MSQSLLYALLRYQYRDVRVIGRKRADRQEEKKRIEVTDNSPSSLELSGERV